MKTYCYMPLSCPKRQSPSRASLSVGVTCQAGDESWPLRWMFWARVLILLATVVITINSARVDGGAGTFSSETMCWFKNPALLDVCKAWISCVGETCGLPLTYPVGAEQWAGYGMRT
jgi:hypothetical protein